MIPVGGLNLAGLALSPNLHEFPLYYAWNRQYKLLEETWDRYREYCMCSSNGLFGRSREGYSGVYFPSCEPELWSNEGNKHRNNTRVSVKQFGARVHTLFYWHNESINYDNIDDLYILCPCLTCSVFVLLKTSQSIANDVTVTRQFWRNHVNNDIQLARYRFYSRSVV